MKTVIITLLLTAASVMSCKPPMPPTDNESACTSSCKQDQRTADVIGEADIITGIASDDFPSLFIQGNHFQFQRKNGLYAPLGIGFMEVIAEQNPVIPLYRTATCKEPEDSIALHQYPFDKDIAERKRKDDNPQEWQDGQNNASCKDGRYYYRYSSESDTLMPLAWRSGSNIHEYLEETVSPELVHAEELRTGERPVLLLGTQLCLLIRFLNAEEHFLDRHAFHAVVLFFFLHKRFVLWI